MPSRASDSGSGTCDAGAWKFVIVFVLARQQLSALNAANVIVSPAFTPTPNEPLTANGAQQTVVRRPNAMAKPLSRLHLACFTVAG